MESVLAIEYINIVDTAIKTPACTPTNPNYANNDQTLPVWAWILICLGILLVIIIPIGIYCYYDKRRNSLKIGTNK